MSNKYDYESDDWFERKQLHFDESQKPYEKWYVWSNDHMDEMDIPFEMAENLRSLQSKKPTHSSKPLAPPPQNA